MSGDGDANIVVVELDGELPAPVPAQRNFLMTSACGVCGKASLRDLEANACPLLPRDDLQLSPDMIYRLPDRLRRAQSVFDSTGGLHAAALFSIHGELESLQI